MTPGWQVRGRWIGLVAALGLVAGCQTVTSDDYFASGGGPVSTGDGDGDGDEDGDGDDDGFLPEPTYDCTPGQAPCPDGAKCTVVLEGEALTRYECVQDTIQHEPYDACTADPVTGKDGCPDAHACLTGNIEIFSGICLPLCTGDFECDTGQCFTDLNTGALHCADRCDPRLPACPTAAQSCLQDEENFNCQFPTELDVGGPGDPCFGTTGGGCDEGLMCLQGAVVPDCSSAYCCTEVCDLSETSSCPSPSSCNELPDTFTYEDLGACYVPA